MTSLPQPQNLSTLTSVLGPRPEFRRGRARVRRVPEPSVVLAIPPREAKPSLLPAEPHPAMAEHAERLVAALSTDQGFIVPEAFAEAEPGPLAGAPDIELINGGVENNVYVHRESKTVFKLPHTTNWHFMGSYEENREAVGEAVERMKKRYTRVNKCKLDSLGAEYVPTYFLCVHDPQGHEVGVIAQTYLDPAEYSPYRLDKAMRLKFEEANVDDLTAANVWVHDETERLVLMDCLFATPLD